MAALHYVVGAYASIPQDRAQQASYYELLGEQSWIQGTEIPFPGDLAAKQGAQGEAPDDSARVWLADHVPQHWHFNTMTMIPGTMQHVWKDGNFGLASPDEDGRLAAIAHLTEAHQALDAFAQRRGNNDITFLEIHSAPTGKANADAFRRSLDEILGWQWFGTRLVIEHSDAFVEGQKPEKGFLPIETELQICNDANIGMTINWGRSAVEGRSGDLPAQHIELAGSQQVLKGLMFSGAGPAATQYGYEWIDGHLPMNPDEPTSLMTAERIAQCAAIAERYGSLEYVGAKVVVPKDASLEQRLSFLRHIYDAAPLPTAEGAAHE